MSKNIQLKLAKIKYSGDSVGDDIRIEIEHPGGLWFLDKQIKNKNDVNFEKIIYQFTTAQNISNIPLNIKIIEKDLIFNDVGSIKIDLAVDLNNPKLQTSTHEIIVKELRGVMPGSKKAIFDVILEVLVLDAIKSVPDDDKGNGWLKIRLEDNKSIESLLAFLKVKTEYTDTKREYFTILEGPYSGQLASVALGANGLSQFISGVEYNPMVRVIYSASKKILTLNGKKYQTIDYPNAMWKKGIYDIEIPDYPHEGGRHYLNQSKRAMTWFRIGHNGERYLHVGSRSLGCMTVIETNRWMEIYNELIKARKGDSLSVGVLEVID
ncbi:MAG: hypothetical protein AAB837_00085 [Patescibacteria group bacterium]